MKPENRHLAAIMFTDIVGYTTLMERDEEKGIALLHKNREIQKPILYSTFCGMNRGFRF